MLTGKLVTLRALERDDLPRLHAFNNDLAVELVGGGDPPMPQSLARLQAEFDARAASGGRDNADFAIEAHGKFIGICSLFHFDHLAHSAELGIVIGDKEYWGHGYGRESVMLLMEYGFRYRNLRRVWLRVHARNARGLKAYAAAGFVEEGRLRQHVYSDGQYDDLVFMAVMRPASTPA